MTITQRLQKPGRFHLELRDDYPDSISQAIGLFDHIVITPTPVEASTIGDAAMLALSIYTGVVTSKPSNRIVEGADLAWWLGTDQGLGDLLDVAVSLNAGTLSQWITALCPVSLTVGTVTNTGLGTHTASYQWMTRREAIDAVCRAIGAEWRVNAAGTIDAASKTLLWMTPTATAGIVVTRKDEGTDGTLRGLEGNLIVPSSDVEQYTTKVFVGGPTGAASTGSTTYKDLRNNTVVMERVVDSPSDLTVSAAGVAASVLGQFNQVRREISLASQTYTVTRFIRPGDSAWVFDLNAGLVDSANQITYRGELISPILLRVMALTWPVEQGCGVYLRKSGATPTYLDITSYVAWESGDVQWEVGAASSNVGTSGVSSAAFLGDNTAVVNRAATETGRRNLLHNGQVSVNQRQLATLALTGGAAQYVADRHAVYNSGVGAANLEYVATGSFVGGAPSPGRPRPAAIQSIKVTTAEAGASFAAADFMQWTQGIEGVNLQHLGWGTADAKPVTLSFDIYSTIATTYIADLYRDEATDRHVGQAFTVPAGWSTVVLTFPGDTTTIVTNDFIARLFVTVFIAAGSDRTGGGSLQTAWGNLAQNKRAFGISNNFNATVNNAFAIVNEQLEVGSIATPFEVRSLDEELRDCLRYFEKSYGFSIALGTNASVGVAACKVFDTTVLTRLWLNGGQFRVTKRATPAISAWSVDGTAGDISLYNNAATKLVISSFNSTSDREVGDFLTTTANAVADTMYEFHWAASAEIG